MPRRAPSRLHPPFTLFLDRSAFDLSLCPKIGVASEDHRLTAPPMHFPQTCSVRTRIRREMTSPGGGGSAGEAFLTLTQRNRVFGATHATAHIGRGSDPGAIS